ncbi:HK97 family phage prohead protease [Mesorhizobium muleiense]|uniref:HK97 family phage prohead protease n=1 Tax=Mesorhizobium muleiense TaxID=1004279 RepID=UPI001F191929|nr:HK97 family phage prohead protease [Mesorhizobium muleiense]MCF6113875.1 HK97 family phage prohead protease [Mesorhizobium muleiense]
MAREYYETRALGRLEQRASNSSIEYTVGPILSVGGMPRPGIATEAKAAPTKALQGYVVRFGKPHAYKGGIDVFVKGCFDASLASKQTVGFWLAHEPDTEIASTDGDLELMADETGLAFRLNNPPQAFVTEVEARKLTAMSAGYRVLSQEYKAVADEQVRFIYECDLTEISICKKGAVKQAFIDVIDTKHRGSLRDDVKAGRVLADGAYVGLMRALAAVQE